MADTTSATTRIAASRKELLDTIADVPSYPQWTKGLTGARVVSTYDDGLVCDAAFDLDAGPISGSYVLRYVWPDDLNADTVSVSWTLVESTLLKKLNGGYTLTTISDDETEVTYDITVGLRIPLLPGMKKKAEKSIISSALHGLKNHAEG